MISEQNCGVLDLPKKQKNFVASLENLRHRNIVLRLSDLYLGTYVVLTYLRLTYVFNEITKRIVKLA